MITIRDAEFYKFVSYIKQNYGIDLTQKRVLIASRLQSYFDEKNIKTFSDYFDHILKDKTGEATVIMLNKLTTNHTFFMRETVHFDYFKDVVLPYWIDKEKNTRDLRIWCAACSTGQEPYTLAMIIAEYLQKNNIVGWDTKILATDLSERALKTAKVGIYNKEDVLQLPKVWVTSYFKSIGNDQMQISDKIKKEVIFKKLNLMEHTFPFKKKLHIIFCRNVMIYFDAPTKRELIDKFYDNSQSGSYLFIGHTESIDREATRYKYIMPAVYRKE